MIDAVYQHGLKLMIGSAGGAGPKAHVDFLKEIVAEIITGRNYSLKVATIYTDVKKETVLRKLKEGKINPCGEIDQLKKEDVERSDQIVAQVGHEPFLKALAEDPDIIIVSVFSASGFCLNGQGGRAYDPAPYIAYCLHRLGKVSHASAWHMGKIMECGGICAIPKGKVILATVRADSFDLLPMDLNTRCTELSVAAHTLYEKSEAVIQLINTWLTSISSPGSAFRPRRRTRYR